MDGYLVRTKSGDKGPFDVFQLMKLVDAGRLPRTAQVIDAENGLAIPLEDLLPDPVEPPPLPVDPPEIPAAAPPPLPARPHAPHRAPQRAPRGGAGRRSRSAAPERHPVARPVRGGAPLRAHRYTGFEHKKSNLAPILLTILAVGVIGGGGGYLLWRDTDRSLEGRWVIDFDATLDLALSGSGEEVNSAQKELAENLLRTMFEGSGITFGKSSFAARLGESQQAGTYRVVRQDGTRYSIEVQDAGSSQLHRQDFTIKGRRMYWTDQNASGGKTVSAVLVKK